MEEIIKWILIGMLIGIIIKASFYMDRKQK